MMKYLKYCLMILLTVGFSGCISVHSVVARAKGHFEPPPYGHTAMDCQFIWEGNMYWGVPPESRWVRFWDDVHVRAGCIVAMPISLVTDTIFMPYETYLWVRDE